MDEFTRGISIKKVWGDAPFAVIMAAINILVFFAQLVFRSLEGYQYLETLGANHNVLVFEFGEYYRIFTSAFLHADIWHIFFNVGFGLIVITSFLERKIGTSRTALVYFSSLLLSGLATAALSSATVWTLGASGAIFGAVGTLFYITVFRKDLVTAQDVQSIRSLIIINVIFTLVIGNISNVGHFSGLIAGFLVAFLFVPRDKSEYEIYH